MLASALLFFYVIILTGSRKALISCGLLCIIWLITFVKDTRKLADRREKKLKFTLLFAALVISVIYFVKYYANTASFERLQNLLAGGSSIRKEMYREAVDLFKTSKFFGIGFNQFRVHSIFRTYAHSTYAELLADGGIFGCIIFFYPVIKTGLVLVKKLRKSPSYQMGMLLALFLVEIFLGTVVIYLYDFVSLLIWTILYMIIENVSLIDAKNHNRGEKVCRKSKLFLNF